ncbi:hypothetical protein DRJ19_01860 [Candidatus Woesearchaeota archaeon]|nr:MAG: hypothetical protein DRJ19_01860 [Candidatus Woesearchaeota archaeon]
MTRLEKEDFVDFKKKVKRKTLYIPEPYRDIVLVSYTWKDFNKRCIELSEDIGKDNLIRGFYQVLFNYYNYYPEGELFPDEILMAFVRAVNNYVYSQGFINLLSYYLEVPPPRVILLCRNRPYIRKDRQYMHAEYDFEDKEIYIYLYHKDREIPWYSFVENLLHEFVHHYNNFYNLPDEHTHDFYFQIGSIRKKLGYNIRRPELGGWI